MKMRSGPIHLLAAAVLAVLPSTTALLSAEQAGKAIPSNTPPEEALETRSETGKDEDLRVTAGEEVVFSSIREETRDGVVLWSEVIGDLDDETSQRAGRPWRWLGEDSIFNVEAWSASRDGEVIQYGYRVLRSSNPSPIRPQIVLGPPKVDPALERELATIDPTAMVPLVLDVRGMPEWNVPLRPEGFALAAEDFAQARERRQRALDERRELAERLFGPVVEAIERLGGDVVSRGKLGGWITARLAASDVPVLLARQDLRRVSLLRGESVTSGGHPRLDDLRSDSYVDARQFLDAGYTGERANPQRHGFGDITIGVVEPDQLEKDACFLFDGADCSGASRLQELFRCDDFDRDGNYCEPVSFYRDNDASAAHGTLVSSVILGDYTQGQGDPWPLGDSAWTEEAGHGVNWENENTGIAREARLIFFGQMADNDTDDGTATSSGFADAFDDAIDRAVDITNNSWSWVSDGATNCSLEAVAPHEQEAENAFDDGILMVVSAGNPNAGVCAGNRRRQCSLDADCPAGDGPCIAQSDVCNISSPADLPKTMAVNAMNAAEPNCQSAYTNCMTDPDFSANGGIDAIVNGSTCTGCVAGVSLTTLNRFCGVTSAAGLRGTGGGCFNGTSASAPVVAGAAALVKDQYLASGQTWINDPGRLHTIMLAMGDRHDHAWGDTSTSQRGIGTSRLTGAGRLKMRLFESGAGMEPWANNVRVVSFTAASTDFSYFPFSQPMGTGTEITKCVAYQVEDMSSKTDISDFDLELRIREPGSTGNCNDPSTPVSYTWIDGGPQIDYMSAITSSQVSLAGRCLHVTLDKRFVTTQGVTMIVNCYASGVLDDLSAP